MTWKKWTIFVAGWIGLGILNFGTVNADVAWKNRHDYASLHQSQRDNIGFIVAESFVMPPLELITSALMSNFWQHGWDVSNKPWREAAQPCAEN